jgi:hemolysin III
VEYSFPQYTAAEASADRALHVLALAAAVGAVAWLLLAAASDANIGRLAALLIYACGLIGTLVASAAYNLTPPGHKKALLRQVDRAMIFVMIAGTYTPFTVSASRQALYCLPIWSLAAAGVAVTLAFPCRFERVLLALYLVMGWMVLGMGRDFLAQLSTPVLLLLFAGGTVYSAGAVVHARCRFPFHNVVWHALVVTGAGLHWAAVGRLLAPPTSSLAAFLG